MTEEQTAEDLTRFLAVERRLLERLSTRVEPFELGTVFLDEEYPDRYNSNFLLAEGTLEGVQTDQLVEAADRILGGAGFRHRELVVQEDRAGELLAPAFKALGWSVGPNLMMVHRRPPDRAGGPAEELPFAEVRALVHEIYRREPWATSPEPVDSFTDQHGKFERVIGARFFAARVDGVLAGSCELYVDGADAQVENVNTLSEHREKGVARAVVTAATDAARASGARHVFIVADDDDWPKELYARLGYDPIGRSWVFIRYPEGEGPDGPLPASP